MLNSKLLFLVFLLIYFSNISWAYEIPENSKKYESFRNTFSVDEGTSVDPFSGNIKLVHTDLSVPGTAGLGVDITRSYNATDKEKDSILGRGWSMNFGTITSRTSSKIRAGNCTETGLVPQKLLFEISNQKIDFYIYDQSDNSNNQYSYISSGNWVAKCISGGGLEAFSPNGLRYKINIYGYDSSESEDKWYVSEISDTHNNKILFDYNKKTLGYVSNQSNVLLKSITTAGNNRKIVFSYHESGNFKDKLDYITYDDEVWNYEYEYNKYHTRTLGDINSGHITLIYKHVKTLTKVIRPDQKEWVFEYDPIPIYWNQTDGTYSTDSNGNFIAHDYGFMTKKKNPLGGQTKYNYNYFTTDYYFNNRPPATYYLRVEKVEKFLKSDLSDGKWLFDYKLNVLPSGSLRYSYPNDITIDERDRESFYTAEYYDQTTITDPDNTKTEYRYHSAYNEYAYAAFDFSDQYTLSSDHSKKYPQRHWEIGLPISEKIYKGSTYNPNTILEKSFEWSKQSLPTSYTQHKNLSFRIALEKLSPYRSISTRKVIKLRGREYITEYTDHDTYGNPQTITETGDGNKSKTTILTYDNKTNLSSGTIWMVGLPKKESITHPSIAQQHYVERTYDDTDGTLKTLDEQGYKVTYTYHTDGNLHTASRVSKTNQNDKQVTTYSDYYLGSPKTIEEPENVTITQDFYPTGLLKFREVSGPERGTPLNFSTTSLSRVDYEYDGLGRLKRVSPRGENDSNIVYSSSENKKTITKGSLTVTYTYDDFGRLKILTERDTGFHEYNRQDRVKSQYFAYDKQGRRTFESYKNHGTNTSHGLRYTYNALNELTKVTNTADNSYKEITHKNYNTIDKYDEVRNKITYQYQSYGDPFDRELISVKDDAGNITNITRDIVGRVTALEQGGITRRWEYSGNDLTYTYNPESGWVAYSYDGFGNLSRQSIPNNNKYYAYYYANSSSGSWGVISYLYDDRNRPINKQFKSDAYGGSVITHNHQYDGLDNITKTSNSNENIFNEYYYYNNKLEKEKLSVDGYYFSFDYTYDSNGSLSENKYPNPTTPILTYTPDAFGRPTKLYVKDGPNGTIGNSLISINKYNPNNTVADAWFANQSYIYQIPDSRQRINSVLLFNSKTYDMLLENSYIYDKSDNLKQINDYNDNYQINFDYDHLNRLNYATTNGTFLDFDYDSRGNITKKPHKNPSMGSITYDYGNDSKNRLRGVSGATNNTFSYDTLGNIRYINTAYQGAKSLYRFDYLSNLRSATNYSSGKVSYYLYDGFDRRVKKTYDGKKTYYMYNRAGKMIMEYTPKNGEILQYVYLNGKRFVKQKIHSRELDFNGNGRSDIIDNYGSTSAITPSMSLVYYHHDPLGSAIAATGHSFINDETTGRPIPPTELLWKTRYAAFGEQTTVKSQPEDNIRYTGHYEDEENGLIYMGARYYDPSIGRFLSMDPVGPVPGNVHSFNRYTYANNNPYKYVDPDGRDAVNIVTGFGDSVSNDATVTIRELLDIDGGIDPESLDYQIGYFIGDIWPTSRAKQGYKAINSIYKAGDYTRKGRGFTKHGAERANERGFSSEIIDAIIDNNKKGRVKEIGDDGQIQWRYQDSRGNTVITNESSSAIVTVYSHPKGKNNGSYIPKNKRK